MKSTLHTVADLMTTDLVVLAEDEEIELVGQLMRYRRVRHLPVVRHGKLVGLVSHRDLLRAWARIYAQRPVVEEGAFCARVPVHEIMNTEVTTVAPETPAAEAARILLDQRFGCLPVVRANGTLAGIVTEADFLRWTVERLEDRPAA